MTNFIYEDQMGFLPKRQMRDNVRTTLNVLEYYDKNPGKEMVLFLVDAEKAFDNFNWVFLTLTMKGLDFGENFCSAVDEIYQNQTARIHVNNELTESVKINKGTRQGCPLLPLLFIIVLEVLRRVIREEGEVDFFL